MTYRNKRLFSLYQKNVSKFEGIFELFGFTDYSDNPNNALVVED